MVRDLVRLGRLFCKGSAAVKLPPLDDLLKWPKLINSYLRAFTQEPIDKLTQPELHEIADAVREAAAGRVMAAASTHAMVKSTKDLPPGARPPTLADVDPFLESARKLTKAEQLIRKLANRKARP
jgi:hypothetical protein